MSRIIRSHDPRPSSVLPGAGATRLPRRAALLGMLALPLAACAGGAEEDSTASDAGSDAGAASGEITVTDPWVKAAEEGMTGAFGTVVNGTDTDLVLVAVNTPATPDAQLHETSSDGSGGMSMSEKEGGFPIPAGGELAMEPGGDHIMFMSLVEPLEPGAEVELTLVFDDGTEVPVTATVKDYAGAEEEYSSEEMDGMGSDGGGMEMEEDNMSEDGMGSDGGMDEDSMEEAENE